MGGGSDVSLSGEIFLQCPGGKPTLPELEGKRASHCGGRAKSKSAFLRSVPSSSLSTQTDLFTSPGRWSRHRARRSDLLGGTGLHENRGISRGVSPQHTKGGGGGWFGGREGAHHRDNKSRNEDLTQMHWGRMMQMGTRTASIHLKPGAKNKKGGNRLHGKSY